MCRTTAAVSASSSSTLAATVGSSMASHSTPALALVTSSLAYGSRISASGWSVSTARAAATMTAVVPTLVLMSQVSSWVRNELIGYSRSLCFSGDFLSAGRPTETRPQQRGADGLVGQVFGHWTAQPRHLIAVVDDVHLPAVLGQPLTGIRTVRLVIGQGLDVDVEPQ